MTKPIIVQPGEKQDPLIMTEKKYYLPCLEDGQYIRFFMDALYKLGLVFNDKHQIIGLAVLEK
jgi:hypothetical protein